MLILLLPVLQNSQRLAIFLGSALNPTLRHAVDKQPLLLLGLLLSTACHALIAGHYDGR